MPTLRNTSKETWAALGEVTVFVIVVAALVGISFLIGKLKGG